MEFTGTNLTLTRNIYTQTGQYGFNFSCTVDNATGQYLFGISGAQGVVEFKLESGKMYHQEKLIHSYKPYQEFIVEAQFTSGTVNVIKDGSPLLYGYPKATGNFDTFYVKRQNAGMGAEFNLSFSGNNIPLYTISTLGYILSSGQEGVTGYFVNQSLFPLRVFDSSIQSDDAYTFGKLQTTLGAGSTGNFSFSGNFDEIDLTDPVLTTFNTSYGDTSVLFTIINASTMNSFVYFTGPTDFTFDDTNVLNRDLTYLNYSGSTVTNTFNAGITFQLSYISGATGAKTFTGSWDLLTGVLSTSLVSMKIPGGFNSNMISGSSIFPPNSLINFQVTHIVTDSNSDGAKLVISGDNVLNPIMQNLSN